jgi:hypothetical protein
VIKKFANYKFFTNFAIIKLGLVPDRMRIQQQDPDKDLVNADPKHCRLQDILRVRAAAVMRYRTGSSLNIFNLPES